MWCPGTRFRSDERGAALVLALAAVVLLTALGTALVLVVTTEARIAASYRALHLAGYAHSLEVWSGEQLVGGLYGVGFERAFCGECTTSMT